MMSGYERLLADILAETKRVWLTEPEDVRAIRLGVLPSDADVRGQYFGPWVMLAGEIRYLGIHAFSTLRRLEQDQTIPVDHLKMPMRELLGLSAGVVEYFGLVNYGQLLKRCVAMAEVLDTRRELRELITRMFTLTNRMNLWMHQTFPWHLAVNSPQRTFKDARGTVRLWERKRS